MTDKELTTSTISKYMDLLRIKDAPVRDAEVDNQLRETRAQLEALGVTVENLVINQPDR